MCAVNLFIHLEVSTFYAKLGGYQLIIDGLRRFRIPYFV